MKTKFITLFIFWFIFLNIFSLKSFYLNALWNEMYNAWDEFEEAEKNFSLANNIEWEYNKWNILYKQKKYTEAIKKYLSLENNNKSEINFRINHNIWNTYYRISEGEKGSKQKLYYLNKTIEHYKKALDIRYDEETKQNLDFVLKKIKDEETKQKDEKNKEEQKKQQEQNKKDENKKQDEQNKNWDWKKGEEKNGNNWKENTDKKEANNSQSWSESKTPPASPNQSKETNGENSKKKWGKNWKKDENKKQEQWQQLNKNQEEALKSYEEALKQAQKQNSDWFNKVYQDNNPNDPFQQMFNDPFFNNSLLNQDDWKKDW